MKRLNATIALVLAAYFGLLFAAGCNVSPRTKVSGLEQIDTAAMRELVALRRAGKIDDDTARTIRAVHDQIDAVLDELYDLAAAADTPDGKSAFDGKLKIASDLIDRLLAMKAKAEKGT